MSRPKLEHLAQAVENLKSEGLYKEERVLKSPQGAEIELTNGERVINLCSNNYLGFANHPSLVKAAKGALDAYGFGMASVRFICGTQICHRELEHQISKFLATESAILYSSCFDANGGLFETLLDENDAIISDELNHASIIDGIRLSKPQKLRYRNNDMNALEERLRESRNARLRLIATDGVFSMDGVIANLKDICDLADRYEALVMVDDSHATGFLGMNGRGTAEYRDVLGRIDIITTTFGKALGGASGGVTAGRHEIVEWLRQRSRPYLFSNSLAPMITAATIQALTLLESGDEARKQLKDNTEYFRSGLQSLGFNLIPGEHPIIPIMLGDAQLASTMANRLLEEGVYVIGFSFPVVPKGKARIRTQMSAALTRSHLDRALEAFEKVGRELGVTVGGHS